MSGLDEQIIELSCPKCGNVREFPLKNGDKLLCWWSPTDNRISKEEKSIVLDDDINIDYIINLDYDVHTIICDDCNTIFVKDSYIADLEPSWKNIMVNAGFIRMASQLLKQLVSKGDYMTWDEYTNQ